MYDFGENIFMNNEKYLDELDGRLQVLNELRKRIIELSKAIIGDTLYKEDFFFTSAIMAAACCSLSTLKICAINFDFFSIYSPCPFLIIFFIFFPFPNHSAQLQLFACAFFL